MACTIKSRNDDDTVSSFTLFSFLSLFLSFLTLLDASEGIVVVANNKKKKKKNMKFNEMLRECEREIRFRILARVSRGGFNNHRPWKAVREEHCKLTLSWSTTHSPKIRKGEEEEDEEEEFIIALLLFCVCA